MAQYFEDAPKDGDLIFDTARPHLGIGVRQGNDDKCWRESMKIIERNGVKCLWES